MLKIGCKKEGRIVKPSYGNESNGVTNLLIDKESSLNSSSNGDAANETVGNGLSMGHKGHYQRVLLKNNVTQDSRTQSLPNGLVDDKTKVQDNVDTVDSCDIHNNKLLIERSSSPQSPWFKTWPERCDKVKSNENSTHSPQNTQLKLKNCDIVENGNIKNKVTLSEALQNISLAYSPLTKQLHLVERKLCNEDNTSDKVIENSSVEKKGHKRNQTGSFSSTISSLSEPSPSRSLLDADEKSLNSLDDSGEQGTKRGITNFFSRYLFFKLGFKINSKL